MTDRNAVRACISQLRRMAEDMLSTAAMLENGVEQKKNQDDADIREVLQIVDEYGCYLGDMRMRKKCIGRISEAIRREFTHKGNDDRGLCVPPDVLEREGIKP